MVCCDTCPFTPTCEEEQDFLADIGLAPAWGEECNEDSLPGEDLTEADSWI